MRYEDHDNPNEQTKLRYQKSTKQWNVRVNSNTIKTENLNNLENIKKL